MSEEAGGFCREALADFFLRQSAAFFGTLWAPKMTACGRMGQTQSSASLPSKELLLAKTKGGTALVNELFQWMISQANIRDFYLMANPAHCKKYIMLTADALNKVFYKIDVAPQEGPKGTIMFRKVEALVPQDKSDPLYKHREINCLRLAFLYVRIFQIFAALSLTILDVEPETEMRLLATIRGVQDTSSAPLFRYAQKGGALDPKRYLPISFEVLRSSLSEIPTNPNYYKFTGTAVYLEYGAQGPDGSLAITYNYSAPRNGRQETYRVSGRITVEKRGTDSLAIQLFSLKQYAGSQSRDLDDVNLYFSRRSIEDIYRDRGSRSIPEGLDAAFKKIAAGERVARDDEEDTSRSGYGPSQAKKEQPGITQFERDMGEVAEGLHTKTIVSAFTRVTPPKAHCMARALQLVSDTGLKAQFPTEIYTSICDAKFLTETRSLPPGGDRVTKEDGLYSLAQLFYDTLKEATPIVSQATEEQYKAFVAKMKFVFEETKETKATNGRRQLLDTVINKVPSGVCDKDTTGRVLKIKNRELIRQLRGTVGRMIGYQINHTANAVKILRKLFLLPIESGKSLQIHPRVLKYGMKEVSVIAEEARTLLIDYYSQCEILYRSGAELIAANKSLASAV
jgi:hypothetical protein